MNARNYANKEAYTVDRHLPSSLHNKCPLPVGILFEEKVSSSQQLRYKASL